MRLGIDGYFMCGKRTGMGVVLENILENWQGKLFEETVLFVPEKLDEERFSSFRNNGLTVCELKRKSFPFWEQFVVPKEAKKHGLDCLWFPFNTGCLFWSKRLILTIHDTIFMNGSIWQQPSLYKKFGQLYRKVVVPRVAKKANGIITDSKSAKNDILLFCPNVENKIGVIYPACKFNDLSLSETEWLSLCQVHGINKSYILAYGSIEQRKNTLRVIQAFEKLCNEGVKEDLVLFGFKEWEQSSEKSYIEKSSYKEHIHVLGYISEEEKTSLFMHADVFLFPSLAEGFGIPVLEAYYYGTPLVTSNVTSIPEIAGDAAVFVDPYNVDDIAQGVKKVLLSDSNEELIHKGKERVSQFSWERIVAQTVDLINGKIK